MSSAKASLVFAMLCMLLAGGVAASNRLVTVESGSLDDLKQTVDAIELYGGRVKIVCPPHIIVADLPDASHGVLLARAPVAGIHATELDPSDFARYGKAAERFIDAWNNVYMGRSHLMGLDEPPAPNRRPLINDIVPVRDMGLLGRPPGAKVYDTSEFMLGTVALGIILAESDGSIDPNQEDWTSAQETNVTSEIISGLDWYLDKAEWRDLTFYTVFYYAVPTGYEPITRPASQDGLWIGDCLDELGFTGEYNFVNYLRDSLGTDWGVLCAIADDTVDPDNCFSDGLFAYSALGGPRFVMTYDNDGWGIANMDAVMAHEMCHSFYALDEYTEAGVPCTATSGYLNAENQNSAYPSAGSCLINKPFCIMRSVPLANGRLCNYTQGQIGWWDDDGDSIPNIMDLTPETVLYEYLPDPCTTFTPAYAGTCWAERLPNLNPRGRQHDITLNRIAKVEYRVDGGGWIEASPTDGAWDTDREGYHFTPDPLAAGTHVFEARAWHTYDLYDTTYAVDTLTIEPNGGVGPQADAAIYLDTSPNPFGPRVEISYSIPGAYGKAVAVSMRVYDVQGREVSRLVEGAKAPGPDRAVWEGTYTNGSPAPSGIYFVDLVAGDSRIVRKVVLTR